MVESGGEVNKLIAYRLDARRVDRVQWAMRLFALVNSRIATLAGPRRPRTGAEMRDVGLIADGAMLVEDGKVAAVGRRDEVLALAGNCEQIDGGGRLATPALVDAHTHPVFAGSRLDDFERRIQGLGYAEIARAGGGIRVTVEATRRLDEAALAEAAWANLRLLARNGAAAFEAKSGYGGSPEGELVALRALARVARERRLKIAPTLLGAHFVPEGHTSASYARLVAEQMVPAAAKEGLARYVDVFVEEGYFEPDDARLIASAAKNCGLGVRLHVDQLRDGGGAALAAELGAVTADHLEHVSSAGIEALKAAGVMPVLLPGSVHCLGSHRYAPAREMIDRGLPVVLATDFNPGTSPVCSLPFVMNLACTQMGMLPSEALAACTVNAAHAVGMGDRIGSLEKGKAADFVLWDAEDPRELAYWVGRSLALQVWVDGEPLQTS